MSSAKIMGYAAMAKGQILQPFYYETPILGEHDVRVAVTHCGVCHTDLSAIEDYYDITDYPFVPGHEIVGHVSEIGKNPNGLKEGDRVGIGWQGRSCGKCEWCQRGEVHLCIKIVSDATWVPYGGFASSVIADSRFAYPLPAELPSEMAAVLMCAGITVFAPLQKYAGKEPQKVGVIGVGGLGHLAIQFAHALGNEVTAISTSPEKKTEAMTFGADKFLLWDGCALLREVEYYFDALLVTVPGDMNWESMLEILKKRGTLILVGFPQISLKPIDLVAHELSITGSFLGNHTAMRDMLSFAAENLIAPKIELMPMSQVNDALRRVKENKARYRVVLANDIASGS
jgi:uncharacterized zinc-type alcohol dehydrogenase-like protein